MLYQDETQVHAGTVLDPSQFSEDLINSVMEVIREPDMATFAKTLLQQIEQYSTSIKRSIFFLLGPEGQLKPLAKCNDRVGSPFRVSKDLVLSAVRHGMSQSRQFDDANAADLLVIPAIAGDRTVGVLHIEGSPQPETVRWLSALMMLTAPRLETFIIMSEFSDWMTQAVETITAAVEAKDTYTAGHSERVARFSLALASELDFSSARRKALAMSALCHDIGKIGIPDAILKKPGALSSEEYEDIKTHPQIGLNIIKRFSPTDDMIAGVLHHHEKWDGTGYPHGLVGEEIPEFGRIIGIADAFDAMTSGRSYSGFMDEEAALSRLCELDDIFEPRLLEALDRAKANGRFSIRTGTQVKRSS